MNRLTLGLLLGIVLLLLPSAAHPQSTTTGAIAGVVRDGTGAVLPGVTVEAASPALIEKIRVATTDAQGNYKIVDLRPGVYTVTFTLPGFATFKREGLELMTGFTATANAEMRVGAIEETLTVTGSSPVVDIQNVRAQNVLSREVLDTLPTAQSMIGFAALTLGASAGTGGTPFVDVGGSKGEQAAFLSIHGMRGLDQRMTVDGMNQNLFGNGGSLGIYFVNQMAIQEVVMATGTGSAEVETSGVLINYVPKDGGNTLKLHFFGAFANESLQSNNLDERIRGLGVSSAPSVKEVSDWGVGVGGRIVRDKLWFYSANRRWVSLEYQPDTYFNKSTNPFAYAAELTRRGYTGSEAWNVAGRLTWQVNPKHKITYSHDIEYSCRCYASLNATMSPETAQVNDHGPMQMPIVTWSYPASNRLLFEAGMSRGLFRYRAISSGQPVPGAVRIQELSTGFQWGSLSRPAIGRRLWTNDPQQQRFSVSYVVGSHAFKAGQTWTEGFFDKDQDVDQGLWYTFLNGRPSSLTQHALPVDIELRLRGIGVYAQDQWTIRRLTLNLGMRLDSFRGWAPAGRRRESRFTPAFSYDRLDDMPNFKDVNPRVGAAYDLFGNGKTAIKGAFGRYVAGVGSELGEANHPATNIVLSSTRTWNDTNANFVPDCDLRSITANGECGALSNSLFGQTFRNTFYGEEVLKGWGNRGYSWQGSLSVQHELRPGVALSVGYFRTKYANFTVTDNELVAPTDFEPFCVTAPVDARLPGGGGSEQCGLYDVTRARFGQVRNLVMTASTFGKQVEQFDGVDVEIKARFNRGGFIQGGVSTGRQLNDNCFVVDTPQQAREGFCQVSPPWSAGTQLKANGAYPLPWDFETSFAIQNLPGASVAANWAAPNAAIAPSLGRNLSACPATGTCTATATVGLIKPGTMFLERVTTADLRFTKIVRMGTARLKGMVDIYNLFNDNTILAVNNTFGARWFQPTSFVAGRLLKFGVQVDF